MVWLNGPVLLKDGKVAAGKGEPGKGTMSSRILEAHGGTNIRFDALISHDITYVGIIQTARASGMRAFPLPYATTTPSGCPPPANTEAYTFPATWRSSTSTPGNRWLPAGA